MNILIGSFDVSTNDPPAAVTIEYVPTVILWKNCETVDAKAHIPYTGDRTFEALVSFVNQNKCW